MSRAQYGKFAIELPVRLQARVVSQLRPFVSRNVLAAGLGRDPILIVSKPYYTAHYDHLGHRSGQEGRQYL